MVLWICNSTKPPQ